MIVLVLVCIATATLFAWLAIELGRLALGDFRVPRPSVGALHWRLPTVGRAGGVGRPSKEPEPQLDDAAVELSVRERLYGRG